MNRDDYLEIREYRFHFVALVYSERRTNNDGATGGMSQKHNDTAAIAVFQRAKRAVMCGAIPCIICVFSMNKI